MIGASFKYIYKLFILSILLNLAFCVDEEQIAHDNYISSTNLLCKDICIDLYIKNSPYIGVNLKLSHNFLISAKTSLINSINEQVYSHNLYGFDLDFLNNSSYNLILSFDVNKSFYYGDDNYSWQQISLIYLKRNLRSNFQIILDSSYDNDWRSSHLNFIYGINVGKNILFSLGLVKGFSDTSNQYDGFLTLNFNI